MSENKACPRCGARLCYPWKVIYEGVTFPALQCAVCGMVWLNTPLATEAAE
jgi:uncharacterized Zn finger protein